MPIVCMNGMCRYNGGENARTTRCSHPFRMMRDCKDAQIVNYIPRARTMCEEIEADEECVCERRKQPGNMLCIECWRRLPDVMKPAFYSKHTRWDAYECAVAWLTEDRRKHGE